MPNTEQLLYQTGKNSHWRFSRKKDVLKNFSIFTEKTPALESFFNKVAFL